jgi:hypothetical protein
MNSNHKPCFFHKRLRSLLKEQKFSPSSPATEAQISDLLNELSFEEGLFLTIEPQKEGETMVAEPLRWITTEEEWRTMVPQIVETGSPLALRNKPKVGDSEEENKLLRRCVSHWKQSYEKVVQQQKDHKCAAAPAEKEESAAVISLTVPHGAIDRVLQAIENLKTKKKESTEKEKEESESESDEEEEEEEEVEVPVPRTQTTTTSPTTPAPEKKINVDTVKNTFSVALVPGVTIGGVWHGNELFFGTVKSVRESGVEASFNDNTCVFVSFQNIMCAFANPGGWPLQTKHRSIVVYRDTTTIAAKEKEQPEKPFLI